MLLLLLVQASIEEGVAVKDMTERQFLGKLAQREVARRLTEAARAAAAE